MKSLINNQETFSFMLWMLSLCPGKKYEVPVESGLTHEKALEILSLFVNMEVTELPEKAHSIVRECKGKTFHLIYEIICKKEE